MQLTRNFWLGEFTKSQTALRRNLDNTPNQAAIDNLRLLCERVLQPTRDHFARPVTVNSGFRSIALNRAIGSSDRSQHVTGEAADVEIPGVPNRDLAIWIRDNLEFDQLILEFFDPAEGPASGWVHVSFTNTRANRKQSLTINRRGTFNGLI